MARTKKDESLAGPEEFQTAMETLRERVNRGMNVIQENPRELYVPGRKFMVVRDIARFEGIVAHGEKFWSGWSRPLRVGEVITCEGWKPGMDTEQEGVNWRARRVPENALWCQVWPPQGLFTPWPMDGLLRALPESYQD